MRQHLKDQNELVLDAFLKEELTPKELEQWQNHYVQCSQCKTFIENSNVNLVLAKQAETDLHQMNPTLKQLLFSSHPLSTPKTQWDSIQKQIQSRVLFSFRVGSQVILEETLRSKAAGVSNQVLPNVMLPESFLQEENISLVFEHDPIDHSLNIGLEGGSARIRLQMKLMVRYNNGECEQFFGKEIAIGSMWFIQSEKVKNIRQIELTYQED